ncbi:hypothetical protein Q3V37_28370 [Micromonospora profundi]|uniref:Uncharacterized protein n=1 Tax=Micromonospora profundi TaxID=1420889 RepID=A0AAJ6HRZ3_9ACTN|nr:hypothetical protein [Micromonospora profundi]NJC13649.1 hypothetical protein [Micromonospora profundi]WLS45232.1 hypothetical protein Q3V37_28370 [Micromonospora profundi]
MQRAVADSLEGVHAGLGETIGTTAAFGFAIALLVSGLASTSVGTQVILSFGIPFALIPVVAFTRRRDLMGNLVNHPLTTGRRITRGRAGGRAQRVPALAGRRRLNRPVDGVAVRRERHPASGPGPALSLTR